jgi:Zn-dependent protease with chaperone function
MSARTQQSGERLTEKWFRDTVSRLELEAHEHPARYRTKVFALAVLGYGYMFAALALAVGLMAASAWALASDRPIRSWMAIAAISGATLGYQLVRALWRRSTPPEGFVLRASDAPALLAFVEKVRRKARAPALAGVYLTADLNAGVSQRPRLGPLGWHQNFLYLGLPFLMTTDLRGLAGTLAHEFGHLSGSHGKIGAWIYRVRASWSNLLAQAGGGGANLGLVLGPFFAIFAPYFSAYSFALARQQEFEADRAARDLVGAGTAGRDLIAINIAARYLHEEFWQHHYRDADTQPQPVAPMRRMRPLLKSIVRHPKADLWRRSALAVASGYADTHPSLRDRLREMGADDRLPDPITQSAAEALFGDRLEHWIDRFDRDWVRSVSDDWKRAHAQAGQQRERLALTGERVRAGTASVDEQHEWATLVERFSGAAAGLDAYQAVLARAPRHVGSRFHAGRLLLHRGDEAGVALLDAAANDDADYAVPAARTAIPWLEAHGRYKDAKTFETRARDAHEQLQQAMREAADPAEHGPLSPPPLTPVELDDIRRAVARERVLREVWLVRRHVAAAPQRVVLVFAFDVAALASGVSQALDRLGDQLDLRYPVVLVPLFVSDGDDRAARRRFADAVRRVPGAQLK